MSPIKTAVLGTGMSAFIFHYPFLEALPEKFEIYAAWERRATAEHSKARSAYPNIKVYTQLDELLADPKVELVVVSLPPDAHVDAVTAALNAGKHVLCEKPFTPTYEEGKRLFDLAKSKNLLLAVYQNRRWDGDFLTAKDVIDSGRLGDIVELESHIDRHRLFRKGNWKDVPSPGSGLVYDLGAHLIDQAVYLFGVPESVTGKVFCQRQIPPLEVEDNFTIVLHYPAKEGKLPVEVILRSTSISCGLSFRYCIKGTRGTFLKFGSDPQEGQLNKGMKPSEGGYGQESSENYAKLWTVPLDADVKALPAPALSTVPTISGNYLALYEEVYESISNKSFTTSVLPEQVLTVEKIIEAAYKSSETSASVKIN
ncbi:gfo/idh/mocA family oxidoreductase [Schizosaccharomyces octosporus yFS286]|uniref:Gfo/idh/mocA family oxidoreductase n=1 Tax=Schizosaccharomyces octosporus (strain yFS286) TaxID=483514 RepID=S9R644_SCHOY|nr:gfo/idh/mocA family oxidoreductase [Schizosaccharomyces octosporus yFS286]EPX73780.1 gfo/idh/mocA family oxidoreductase [Schizosaccharomyces octosporus yFS286]